MNDLTVNGYNYDNRKWGWCPHPTRPDPKPHDRVWLREEFLAGREIQAELSGEAGGWSGGAAIYAFKADTGTSGVRQGRSLWRSDRKRYLASGPRDIIGVCRMARLEEGVIVEERIFVLNGLDEGHALDRLTSEMWRWHAEVFGPGPREPEGQARHQGGLLAQKIPDPDCRPSPKPRI